MEIVVPQEDIIGIIERLKYHQTIPQGLYGDCITTRRYLETISDILVPIGDTCSTTRLVEDLGWQRTPLETNNGAQFGRGHCQRELLGPWLVEDTARDRYWDLGWFRTPLETDTVAQAGRRHRQRQILGPRLEEDTARDKYWGLSWQRTPLETDTGAQGGRRHRQRQILGGERGGSVVECRTPEREVRGSRPTARVLCP